MRSPLRHWLLPAITALLLAACASTPQPDPTQVRLNDIDERLVRVERVVNNQSLLQLSQRFDELETQLRALRGQAEELQNSDQALRKQQRDLYADLDRRLKALELAAHGAGAAGADGAGGAGAAAGAAAGMGAAGAEAGAQGGAAGGAPAPGGDQAAYTHAFDALKGNDFAGAIAQFHEFLRLYPQSPLAGNAQYWLGEAYYVTHDYDNAVSAFRAVGTQYPQSPKVPDALLKLGLTQVDQNKLTDARATLRQVVLRYSGTNAAKLAAAKLQNLPPEGQ